MTRTMKLTATALLGLSLALSAAACGDEQAAPSAESSATSVATPPSDRSVPVVPGPKPKSSTAPSTETERESTQADAESCGSTKGPDGALQIKLVEGDITCDTAEGVAKEYSPLIATGKPQDVKGWECGPSTTAGELARCTKDSQAFALVP